VSLKVPVGAGWIHELKHDGFRVIALKDGDDVRLWSRNGRNWSAGMVAIRAAVMAVARIVLDGEAVAHPSTRSYAALGPVQRAFTPSTSCRSATRICAGLPSSSAGLCSGSTSSSVTKAALAAAKARGKKLGTPANLRNQDARRLQGGPGGQPLPPSAPPISSPSSLTFELWARHRSGRSRPD